LTRWRHLCLTWPRSRPLPRIGGLDSPAYAAYAPRDDLHRRRTPTRQGTEPRDYCAQAPDGRIPLGGPPVPGPAGGVPEGKPPAPPAAGVLASPPSSDSDSNSGECPDAT